MDKSPHILNTSATLFGLCFVVLTSLKALKLSAETFADELTGGFDVLIPGELYFFVSPFVAVPAVPPVTKE